MIKCGSDEQTNIAAQQREGRNVSELQLQGLVTGCGLRSRRGGFWVGDSVSRFESVERVGSLMRVCLGDCGRELCLGCVPPRGPWAFTLVPEELLL